ncbi:MAG: SufD family Fe-S cluster assembly protein [Firmicutes bacterium]|nr:SufD family Fe-S cluster assembly protein [Bacillota bacterium]
MLIKANPTPMRTSRNFGINNIKVELPENINESIGFGGAQVFCGDDAFFTSEGVSVPTLRYGQGEELSRNISEHCNSKYKLYLKGDGSRIEYTMGSDNPRLINVLDIEAQSDTSLTVIYKCSDEAECFHNGALRINIHDGCRMRLNVINMTNGASFNFDSVECTLGRDSRLDFAAVDFGGRVSAANYFFDLRGDNSDCHFGMIYLGGGSEVKDINCIAELYGKKTNAVFDVKGAIDGECRKSFKGTINFLRGCRGAVGTEDEYCLLLSDGAKSTALPMMLCTEEDVEGNHSTASGKADPSRLFYIMSRGLSYRDAVKLIVRANFSAVLDMIVDEEIRALVSDMADGRLS